MAVKVDGALGLTTELEGIGEAAERRERTDYDAAIAAETSHDPFLPLLLAAEHTERLHVGTAIAVAFARTPMTVAATARDLQVFSKGRLLSRCPPSW